jgi:peptide/nickel transport system permease protein
MLERLHSQATRETIVQPFVRAIEARGVPAGRVRWRNTLRPALRPVLTIYGVVVGSLLSGSFVVEMVTAWPGLGRLMFDALRSRDVYLVAGCTIAGSLFLSIATVAADVALAAIDPRVRE